MKTKYEYDVVIGDTVVYYAENRQEARDVKAVEKADGYDAKIIQRKYTLQTQREVR